MTRSSWEGEAPPTLGPFELAKAGQSVLMVDDKGNLGGDCLYAGCIPSKSVRTRILDYTSTTNKVDPDEVWKAAIELKEWVQEIRYEQHMEEIKEHEPNLTFLKGWAIIEGPNSVRISTEEGEVKVETKNLVIGAGAENVILNIPGKELVLTSDDLFAYRRAIKRPPRSLAIIGGGYIGVEVADVLSRLGVHVTIVEMMDGLLPNMPPDVSKAAMQRMQEVGVDVHLGFAAAGIGRSTRSLRLGQRTARSSRRRPRRSSWPWAGGLGPGTTALRTFRPRASSLIGAPSR